MLEEKNSFSFITWAIFFFGASAMLMVGVARVLDSITQ